MSAACIHYACNHTFIILTGQTIARRFLDSLDLPEYCNLAQLYCNIEIQNRNLSDHTYASMSRTFDTIAELFKTYELAALSKRNVV